MPRRQISTGVRGVLPSHAPQPAALGGEEVGSQEVGGGTAVAAKPAKKDKRKNRVDRESLCIRTLQFSLA